MKTEEELRQIASDMTSDTNNVNKYLSESPRIANFLIGYDYATQQTAHLQNQLKEAKELLKEIEADINGGGIESPSYYKHKINQFLTRNK